MKTGLQRKLLSLFVIFAMVLTLLPAGVVQAATSQYFQFANFSTNIDDPTQVNTSIVDLIGTFNGVSAQTITYKVEQIVNGQVVAVKKGTGVNPIIENGNTFKFLGIELVPGLNKITVTGTNPAGNTVPGVCYVNFTNVPVLYDVKLVDGRPLEAGKAPIIDTQTAVLLLKAPNAKQVTINGVIAFGAGGDSFVASNIRLVPGLNNLAIVASNDTMKYTLNRQIIFYPGVATAHEVKFGNLALDNNPTIGPASGTSLSGLVTGKMTFRKPATAIADPTTFTLDLIRINDDGSRTIVQTDTADVVPLLAEERSQEDATHRVFRFVSRSNFMINTNAQYELTVSGSYGAGIERFPMPFSYRNANTAYVTQINQLYNVTLDATGKAVYQSSTVFPSNSVIFELPFWLEARIQNTFSLADVSLTSSQNGATVPNTVFVYEKYLTTEGHVAFKINNMPAGEQTLTMTIDTTAAGGGIEKRSVTVNYIPAPFIQLNNVFNSKVFKENGTYPADSANTDLFTTIRGRLVNFNTISGSPDLDTVQIQINGKSMRLNTPAQLVNGKIATAGDATDPRLPGSFEFIVPDDMKLIAGPNKLTISGTGNGVPVSTSLTLYMFSDKTPQITDIKPVPFDGNNPLPDDDNLKFKPNGTMSYVTNERSLDVRFTVSNVDNVVILIDGEQVATAARSTNPADPANTLLITSSSTRGDLLEALQLDPILTSDLLTKTYYLRLKNVKLPKTGLRSIVIQTTLDSANAAQTLTILREISPYTILSPKLPNERVVNQNFLPLAILAEGADQVLIGKDQQMVKDKSDIFRYDLLNLKAGINKIKFTVVRGTQKLEGTLEVNYAAVTTAGAQYKTLVPRNGTVKAFSGDVTLNFGKGTVLKRMNERPGDQSERVDLFDSQQILFGIADREDGRTIKTYNKYTQVGWLQSDPDLVPVQPMEIAVNLLRPPSHFGYASNLIWMDAGYFDNSSMAQYKTVHGQQPYAPGSFFYLRNENWMEPSQRGSITLKYDPYIRDVIASKLSVWRFTDNKWTNVGGKVNAARKEITAPFDGFGFYAVFEDRYSFDDIISHPYARNQLELMFAKGIMNQKDNNEFGVYDNITRGEFATMLVKILDIPLSYNPQQLTFDDVPNIIGVSPFWDYRYIETAVQKGIIRGLGPRVFSPNGNLTREQAAVMIARAMNLKMGLDVDKERTNLQKVFTDANTIDFYAITATAAVQKEGIITGRPNELTPGQRKPTFRFDPFSFLNRADASIIAERVMRKLKKL